MEAIELIDSHIVFEPQRIPAFAIVGRRRHYDPSTGRWASKDPSGFSGGTTNLYEYALSNPVNFVDPHGR